MADSPSRSDPQDSASPWGDDSRPWWSTDAGDGTGPHAPVADGTGPQIMLRGGTGSFPVIPDGTGPLPMLPGPPPPGGLPPGPPPTAPRRPPKFLLIAGAVMVGGIVLMAGVLAFRMDRGGGGGGGPLNQPRAGVPASRMEIDAGPVAGGLRKDGLTAPPASAAYPFVAGAIRAAGATVAVRGQAVYSQEPARPVNVLFVGGTGSFGDPAGFLQKAQPTTFIAGQDADPGPQGGKAVCGTFAVLAETHTYCAWATEDSYGVVASNRPSLNPHFALMADLMRRIRKDVERPG